MLTQSTQLVSASETAFFMDNGAVCLRGVFDPHWVQAAADGIQATLEQPSPYFESLVSEGSTGAFIDDYCNWQKIPALKDYVFQSPAAAIAKALLDSQEVVFYHEHVLIKEPGAKKATPWHQDQPYYPVAGRQICSIWMPVDPVPLECSLQFVKGSHNWGKSYIPRKFATEKHYATEDAEALKAYVPVPEIDESYEILSWALKPGDCVVFHGATLHGAAGNRSLSSPRRILATRWLGDDARFVGRPWEISPPITGGLKPGDPMACETFPVIPC